MGILLMISVVMIIFSLRYYDISPSNLKSGEQIVYDEDLLSFDLNWKISDISSKGSLTEYIGKRIDLPKHIDTKKGSMVTISNLLPASLTEGTYLAFMGTDSFVSAKVDGEEIFKSPVINIKDGATPLPGWVFIPLKGDYSAKEVSLSFEYPYAYSSGMLPKILIGTHSELLLYASYSSYFSLYIGISVIVMGVLIFIFSLVNLSAGGRFRGFIYLGIYVAALGFILINQANIPRMEMHMYYVEYMASNLIIRVLPMIHSLCMYMSNTDEKRKKTFLFIFMAAFADFVLSFALHFLGILDLTASLSIGRLFMILEALIAAYCEFKDRNETKWIYAGLMTAGLVFLALGMSADMISHYLYTGNALPIKYIGAVLFSVCALASVIAMAYTNALTGLRLSNELTKSRIRLMISQIQPHFVYNTLNAIRAMIKKEPDKAYDMIYDFAGYLRYNINALSDVEIIPFSEELKHIKVYTEIEAERFRERINVVYETSGEDFGVPPLSVQPFVENAVKHGICRKKEGGTVIVRSQKMGDSFIVEIIDDGIGFDTSILEQDGKKGVGIRNAVYRLKSLSDADVNIESKLGAGTHVTIIFPGRRTSLNENDISR